MNSNVNRILGEENVKDSIDELCEDVKDFDKIDFLHIIWGKRNKKGNVDVMQRFFGAEDTLIAELGKAQFAFMKEAICEREGED